LIYLALTLPPPPVDVKKIPDGLCIRFLTAEGAEKEQRMPIILCAILRSLRLCLDSHSKNSDCEKRCRNWPWCGEVDAPAGTGCVHSHGFVRSQSRTERSSPADASTVPSGANA